ncbi:MAG: serine-rich protein [Anaerolineales bacterium]|jgi:hypothetical protein
MVLPVAEWIESHVNAAARTVEQLMPRLVDFVGGAEAPVLTPADLSVHASGLAYLGASSDREAGQFLDYLWFHLTEREGGIAYPGYRVIQLLQLKAIPLNARADEGAVAKMETVLRGIANSKVDIVYLVGGIYHPERRGIVQCYGAVARAPGLETAVARARQGAATLLAGLSASYPQIRFKPLEADTGRWISDALQEMPFGLLTVGHPDPRQNARGSVSDLSTQLTASSPGSRPHQFTLQQNELVMRGMAQLEEDFLLQVLLTPLGRGAASDLLTGLMEYTSAWASWQTGHRSFNLGTSLPILFSGALNHSAGTTATASQALGTSDGVSHTDSSAHTVGQAHTHTDGVAVTNGLSTTHSVGESSGSTHTSMQSTTDGTSSVHTDGQSNSVTGNLSVGIPGVLGAGLSGEAGVSSSDSTGVSHSATQGTSDAVSHGTSVQDSTTVSHAVTSSSSDSETASSADTKGTADGTSHAASQLSGTALSRGLASGWGEGLSYGLAPSVSLGDMNQWQNDPALVLVQALREQQALLQKITKEGGFYADVYALARTERGKQALLALIPQAFQGEEEVILGVQTRTLSPAEEGYIRLHARAMTPSTREVRMPEAITAYLDSTLLTPLQASAYMTPGLLEEGLARTVQEAIPPFAFDPSLPGDVVLGYQYSTERGVLTTTPLRLAQEGHFHTAFVADTGFGKSVAAERLAYETTFRWHYRTIVLDFGQGWRKALNWAGMEGRVDIRQLYPGAVRPIRWNPLQVPKRTPVYRYRNMLVELFANAGRMGPRQLGFMRDALTDVYRECGVIVDGRNEEDFGTVRDEGEEEGINLARAELHLAPRLTKNFTLANLEEFERQALFVQRSHDASILNWVGKLHEYLSAAERVHDQNSRSSLQGVVLRLEPLAEGELLDMYGPGMDAIAIEDLGLLGPKQDPWGITVIEGGAQMDEFAKSALLSLIAATLYEDAVVRRRQSLSGFQFPPLQIFFEEANKVLTGVDTGSAASDRDSAGTNQTAQIFTIMWRDGRKYKVFLHPLVQTISELPAGILSSCNNGCFGQTKNDEDRKAILAHLARNTKGFVNSEYDRFLARMPIGMFIVKLGYTEEITRTEPYLIEPTLLKSEEPSDEQIVAAFSPRKRFYRRSAARVAGS